MARPKGSKNKATTAKATVINHNPGEITDDHRQKLLIAPGGFVERYKRLLADKKDADNALKALGKEVKADLGKVGMLQVKLKVLLETPKGEAEFKTRMEAEVKAARWFGMPIGHVDDLFPESKQQSRDRAAQKGRVAGLTGADAKPPFPAGSEEGQVWMDAWHKGQQELAAGVGTGKAGSSTSENVVKLDAAAKRGGGRKRSPAPASASAESDDHSPPTQPEDHGERNESEDPIPLAASGGASGIDDF